MPRDIGPVEKLSRREGVELDLKGERAAAGKSGLDRRPYPPGQHGRGHRRLSEYALRLREKQRLKRYYGIREHELRRLLDEARRGPATPGENLLRRLERRLDNAVYRLGLASTRRQARQFVTHGHIRVDGAKVDRPSYAVQAGEVITLADDTPIEPVVRRATDLTARVPSWLLADHEHLSGRVERLPTRHEIAAPVNEQLIVEHYAK